MNLIFLRFIEVWMQRFPCKVNATPVTYFACDPLHSYFNEPQKNEIYFLNDPKFSDRKMTFILALRLLSDPVLQDNVYFCICMISSYYWINIVWTKFPDRKIRQVWANSLDPDQIARSGSTLFAIPSASFRHKPYEPHHEKTCFCHMRTTKLQFSLRIRAVWSVPLLFAAWIVSTCYSRNFKPLASLISWAGRFKS